MKLILFLLSCNIFIYCYVAYFPIPDLDKQQWEKYHEKAEIYSAKLNVPVEILVYYRIDTAEKAVTLAKYKNNLRGKSLNIWIKNMDLNWGEVRQINKFNLWKQKQKL